jgi:hypothetical protein
MYFCTWGNVCHSVWIYWKICPFRGDISEWKIELRPCHNFVFLIRAFIVIGRDDSIFCYDKMLCWAWFALSVKPSSSYEVFKSWPNMIQCCHPSQKIIGFLYFVCLSVLNPWYFCVYLYTKFPLWFESLFNVWIGEWSVLLSSIFPKFRKKYTSCVTWNDFVDGVRRRARMFLCIWHWYLNVVTIIFLPMVS